MAITKGTILNLSSNADVFARGERYYRDGKLLSFTADDGPKGVKLVKASVEGNYKNYNVHFILEANGTVKQYTCSCESHSIWRGACKHVVAALFALAEGNTVSGSAAAQQARNLTDTLERLIFEDIDANLRVGVPVAQNPVKLEIRFHYENRGEAYLTFQVGRTRMYVIKNISSFLSSVKKKELVSYGSGLKFKHSLENFDEPSQKILEFLTREDSLYNEAVKKISRQVPFIAKNNSRALYLSERNMDEFFDLFANKEITADVDGETRLCLISGLPEVRLRVAGQEDKTVLSAEPFNYRVKYGLLYYYFISKAAIHRVEKNDAMVIIHILQALSSAADSQLIFTREERQRFHTIIFPRLNKLGIVSSIQGDIPAFQSVDMTAKLFFDSEKHDITGKVSFHYGDTVIDPLDDPAASDIPRDAAAEYLIKRRLAVLGFAEDKHAKQFTLSDEDQIYSFLYEPAGMAALKDIAQVYVSDALDKRTVTVNIPKVGVRLQGNLLDVTLDDTGFSLHDLMESLESYRARKKFHRLRDGRFMSLEGEGITAAAELLEALDASKKDIHGNTVTMQSYRALYVDTLMKESAPSAERDDSFREMIARFTPQGADTAFELPDLLANILREYQKTGYQWLRTLAHYGFGGILADDMGLGKTLQVIAVLLAVKLESKKRKRPCSLVVAPTSLLYNWEQEIRHFAPSLVSAVVTGLPEKRKEILLAAGEADVLITTYDMMKRDIASYAKLEFEYIIADEAQNIKNAATQNARALKNIKGRVRYALTGTPIENALTELWSIFDFIMPGYLHSAHKFTRLYESPIVHYGDTAQAGKLRRQIAPFVLRRIKKNVLTELPDKTETTLLAEMTTEQKKIYLAHLMRAKGEFDDMITKEGFAGSRIRILAQLTRLRQICCHPSLFIEDYKGGSGKLDLALETIQMAVESAHRVLLFSQFTSMLDILRRALDESPFEYFYLDGASKAQERMNMTGRFNAGERDLFLISLKAGGTGLNLTGADVVIHYDPWWNPSVMDQASDRAHRYGQEKAVQIFNIVAKDTIEEKIMELQTKKRGLIDAVITEGGSFLNALTEEEVWELFMYRGEHPRL